MLIEFRLTRPARHTTSHIPLAQQVEQHDGLNGLKDPLLTYRQRDIWTYKLAKISQSGINGDRPYCFPNWIKSLTGSEKPTPLPFSAKQGNEEIA